jgi:hypothetical protein
MLHWPAEMLIGRTRSTYTGLRGLAGAGGKWSGDAAAEASGLQPAAEVFDAHAASLLCRRGAIIHPDSPTPRALLLAEAAHLELDNFLILTFFQNYF